MGIQMLLDLVAERISTSRWARVEFDDDGRLVVGYPAIPRMGDSAICVLCKKVGLGNDGIGF